MRCGETSLIGEKDGVAISMRCRRWQCEYCKPINQDLLAKRIRDGRPEYLITLTVNARLHDTPVEAAAALTRAWSLLRRRLKRLGMALPFLAVFAETEIGWPHLHIVVRGPVPSKKSLSAMMRELIGAPNVDVRPVTEVWGLADYIAKQVRLYSGRRRFWASRLWSKAAAALSEFGFTVTRIVLAPLDTVEAAYRGAGIACRRLSRHRLKFSPP